MAQPEAHQPRSTYRPLRILTNTIWFDGKTYNGRPITALRLPRSGLGTFLWSFLRAPDYDAIVLNMENRRLWPLCALKLLTPRQPWKLISVDLILTPPTAGPGRLILALKRRLLRAVDLFALYFKDLTSLQAVYQIDPRRVRYVPFKVNDYARVRATAVSDDGYVLACGRSYRDYRTLCAAVRTLGVPVVILADLTEAVSQHGSVLSEDRLPPNVKVVTDDGTSKSWINWIAHSRCIVVPMLPNTLSPSGIGTYLVAMALGKCVIISDGLSTRGLLDLSLAVVVPPADPLALHDAIARVYHDVAFRESLAAAGQAYALSLGDENRLAQDIVQHVGRLIEET